MNRLSFVLLLFFFAACSEIATPRSGPEHYLGSAIKAREQATYAAEREREALRRGALYRERHGQQTLDEEQAAYENAYIAWQEETGFRIFGLDGHPIPPPLETLEDEDCGLNPRRSINRGKPCRSRFVKENYWERAAEKWGDSFTSWTRATDAWDAAALAFSMHLEAVGKADSSDQATQRNRQVELSQAYTDIMTYKVVNAKINTESAKRLLDEAVCFEAEAELADTLSLQHRGSLVISPCLLD